MIAKKGSIQTTHHFAHEPDATGRTCTTAGETALHKFAKAVLDERLELLLPELAIGDGEDRLLLSRERPLKFEKAILEKKVDDIVPDVTCIIRERRLIVEFKVTHPCGDEKITHIRERNLAAIEIDLSAYREMYLESLAGPILFEAKRTWLHSPKIDDGLVELERRRQERRRAFEERAVPLGRAYMATCEELRALSASSPGFHAVTSDGLGHAVGIEVPGFGCFTVPPGDWQSALLSKSLDYGVGGGRPLLTVEHSVSRLRRMGWVGSRFAKVGEEEAEIIRTGGVAFATPSEAIEAWLGTLSRLGVVQQADGNGAWILGRDAIRTAAHARDRHAVPGRRPAEIREIVDDLLSDLPAYEAKGFSFEQWAMAPIPGRTYPANQAVHFEEPDFAVLKRDLADLRHGIRSMPREGMDLMGLPLSAALWRALERKRREGEERERARQAQELREEDERVERVLAHARRKLGSDGNAWAITGSADIGGKSPVEAAREDAAGLALAMRLADDEAGRREREVRAALAAELAQDRLKAEAAQVFQGDRLSVYLGNPQPALGGKSPLAYCVDDASFRKCVELTLR
jgi:hypothetical protein